MFFIKSISWREKEKKIKLWGIWKFDVLNRRNEIERGFESQGEIL